MVNVQRIVQVLRTIYTRLVRILWILC